MKADGFWSFWNQYGSVPLNVCVERAKQLQRGVIVKHGFWTAFDAFKAAGVPVGIERDVYPSQPVREAERLSEGIARGAEFAVINAEVEWERAGEAGGNAMQTLINTFRGLQPGVEFYASVDTRAGRTSQPYQRVLGAVCTGWMPMIYPKAFFFPPFRPVIHVPRSFTRSLDEGQDFQGKPVYPTIQTYDGVGEFAVRSQIAEVERRGLPGLQSYTICHATNVEWAAYVAGQTRDPVTIPSEDNALQAQVNALQLRLHLTAWVFQWAGYALGGQEAPESLLRQLHHLLHLSGQVEDE